MTVISTKFAHEDRKHIKKQLDFYNFHFSILSFLLSFFANKEFGWSGDEKHHSNNLDYIAYINACLSIVRQHIVSDNQKKES